MGTHPIFESDFDCLTALRNREQYVIEYILVDKHSLGSLYGLHDEQCICVESFLVSGAMSRECVKGNVLKTDETGR